uniref:UspA domain-containing protein n=1 Tax=Magallana gigas TaxID=29159 RepID=A0A8W8LYN4_MAGGI
MKRRCDHDDAIARQCDIDGAIVNDATLSLFRCNVIQPAYLTTDPSKASELANEEERKIKEMFADWKEQIKRTEIDGCVVRTSGEPGRAIIKIARGEGADYIVMGSRGLGTLRKTFMGSVSDYIVHHAHIPVTVVRNRDEDNK